MVRSFLPHKYELCFDEPRVLISEKDFRTKRRSWYKTQRYKLKSKAKDWSNTNSNKTSTVIPENLIFSCDINLEYRMYQLKLDNVHECSLKRRQMSSPRLQIQDEKNRFYNTLPIFVRTSTNSTRNILFLYKEFLFSWDVKSKYWVVNLYLRSLLSLT